MCGSDRAGRIQRGTRGVWCEARNLQGFRERVARLRLPVGFQPGSERFRSFGPAEPWVGWGKNSRLTEAKTHAFGVAGWLGLGCVVVRQLGLLEMIRKRASRGAYSGFP